MTVLELALAGRFEDAVRLADGEHGLTEAALLAGARSRWPDASDEDIRAWSHVIGFATPEMAQGVYNLGVALWAVGELRLGLAALEHAASAGDPDGKLAVAEALMFLREPDAALPVLRELVGTKGELGGRASGVLGRHFFRELGRSDRETRRLLRRASQRVAEFRLDYGELLVARGQRARGLRVLASEAARGNPAAPILVGNLYADMLGDARRAEQYYRLGVEAGDAHSAYNLAALLDESGRESESRTWLEYAAAHGDARAIPIGRELLSQRRNRRGRRLRRRIPHIRRAVDWRCPP